MKRRDEIDCPLSGESFALALWYALVQVCFEVTVEVLTDPHGDFVAVQPNDNVSCLGVHRENRDYESVSELFVSIHVAQPPLEHRTKLARQ